MVQCYMDEWMNCFTPYSGNKTWYNIINKPKQKNGINDNIKLVKEIKKNEKKCCLLHSKDCTLRHIKVDSFGRKLTILIS